MTPERIITAAKVTGGEQHDGKQLKELIDKSKKAGLEVEEVIGDKAYAEKDNIKLAKEQEIKLIAKLNKTIMHGNRSKEEEYEYNKDAEMYVCKAIIVEDEEGFNKIINLCNSLNMNIDKKYKQFKNDYNLFINKIKKL